VILQCLLFNRSRAFRRAWDIGPRALGQGTSRNVSWELGSGAAWFDKPLGCLLELSWGHFERPGVSWGGPGGVLGRPGGGPGRLWRPLGGLLELLKVLGRLRGCFQGLMGRSWEALGALVEASWSVLEASWTPKGRPEEAQKGPKWSPGGMLNRKLWILPKPQNS
jgi:hypothetical protein